VKPLHPISFPFFILKLGLGEKKKKKDKRKEESKGSYRKTALDILPLSFSD